MNYFELFNIPVSLQPDVQKIKKSFYELSRKHHPDFFTNASPEEQATALETSSRINKAFKVFQNKDETIKYVLQLHGLLEEEEKYVLPPHFLMEMLELNEQVIEAKMDDDAAEAAGVENTIRNIEEEIYAPVKDSIENYRESIITKEALLQVKEYYYKKKYLNRILEGLKR